MKKYSSKVGEVFFHFKSNFDCRKSFNFDELLRDSVRILYFEGRDDLEIDDIVMSIKSRIRTKINQEISNYNKHKSYLRYYWSPEEDDILIGNACPLPSDTETELENKRILGNAFLLENILIDLKPDIFEVLCKQFLKKLGCQFCGETRITGDGGIDFFGTLRLNETENNPFAKKISLLANAKIHFVGQAKRYSNRNPIQPQDIREFLGSALVLEFTQGWSLQKELAIENLPPKYLMPKDPIAWLFFSTSFATINARNLADLLGIYFQDGEDISRWIAQNILSACSQSEDELQAGLYRWLSL